VSKQGTYAGHIRTKPWTPPRSLSQVRLTRQWHSESQPGDFGERRKRSNLGELKGNPLRQKAETPEYISKGRVSPGRTAASRDGPNRKGVRGNTEKYKGLSGAKEGPLTDICKRGVRGKMGTRFQGDEGCGSEKHSRRNLG